MKGRWDGADPRERAGATAEPNFEACRSSTLMQPTRNDKKIPQDALHDMLGVWSS